jgi:hypothetical protein
MNKKSGNQRFPDNPSLTNHSVFQNILSHFSLLHFFVTFQLLSGHNFVSRQKQWNADKWGLAGIFVGLVEGIF